MNLSDLEERKLHEALRSLPDRIAPVTLESRVFSAISAGLGTSRQRSWLQWPIWLRGLFLCTSVLVGGGVITLSVLAHRAGPGLAAGTFHFLPSFEAFTIGRALLTAAHALKMAGDAIPENFSAVRCIFAFGLLYALVLGLAGTAYRTLARSQ